MSHSAMSQVDHLTAKREFVMLVKTRIQVIRRRGGSRPALPLACAGMTKGKAYFKLR